MQTLLVAVWTGEINMEEKTFQIFITELLLFAFMNEHTVESYIIGSSINEHFLQSNPTSGTCQLQHD